jgi:dihydrofolate reductase
MTTKKKPSEIFEGKNSSLRKTFDSIAATKAKKPVKGENAVVKTPTFTLTLTLENQHGFEKEKTMKLEKLTVNLISDIITFIGGGLETIKNKKPHVMSRSRGSDC